MKANNASTSIQSKSKVKLEQVNSFKFDSEYEPKDLAYNNIQAYLGKKDYTSLKAIIQLYDYQQHPSVKGH